MSIEIVYEEFDGGGWVRRSFESRRDYFPHALNELIEQMDRTSSQWRYVSYDTRRNAA